MRVSKWGNSLAVRLPAVLVQALDLKEGRGLIFTSWVSGPLRSAKSQTSKHCLPGCTNSVGVYLRTLNLTACKPMSAAIRSE